MDHDGFLNAYLSLSWEASATTSIPGSIGIPDIVDGYSHVISVSKRVVSVTIPVFSSTSAGLPISVLKMALSRIIHGV